MNANATPPEATSRTPNSVPRFPASRCWTRCAVEGRSRISTVTPSAVTPIATWVAANVRPRRAARRPVRAAAPARRRRGSRPRSREERDEHDREAVHGGADDQREHARPEAPRTRARRTPRSRSPRASAAARRRRLRGRRGFRGGCRPGGRGRRQRTRAAVEEDRGEPDRRARRRRHEERRATPRRAEQDERAGEDAVTAPKVLTAYSDESCRRRRRPSAPRTGRGPAACRHERGRTRSAATANAVRRTSGRRRCARRAARGGRRSPGRASSSRGTRRRTPPPRARGARRGAAAARVRSTARPNTAGASAWPPM